MSQSKQRGFILTEFLAGMALMLAAISCLALYSRAEVGGHQEAERQVAGYLVQGEMACLQALAAEGRLQAGHYAWLGDPSWLQSEHASFTVTAGVTPDGDACWHAVIRADWQGVGRSGSLQTTGEVVTHAAPVGKP